MTTIFPTNSRDLLTSYGLKSETAASHGWERLRNGELVSAAHAAGFDTTWTRDSRFAEAASKSLQALPQMALVVIKLPQRSWKLYADSSELDRRSSELNRRSSELNRRSSGLDRRSSGLDRSGLELTEWECPSNECRSELRQLRSQLPGAGSIGVSGCGRDRCGPLYG